MALQIKTIWPTEPGYLFALFDFIGKFFIVLKMSLISLHDILIYLGERSRPLIESEAVLNTGDIIMCGINIENNSEIFVLCQQTSYLKGPSHSLRILIKSDRHLYRITVFR